MPVPISGPENLEGLSSVVYDAAAVPDEVWYGLQNVHHKSLKADLPREEWDRAAKIVKLGELAHYRASRINPGILVGNEWQGDQLFRDPQVTVMYENGEVIGGVTTSINTSGDRLPEPLRPIERHAKMLVPDGWNVPLIGDSKYTHIRDVFVHPDLRPEDDTSDNRAANRVALTGLWQSLQYRHLEQGITAYVLPDDPADRSMVALTQAMGMTGSEGRAGNTLPGYRPDSSVRRVTGTVRTATTRIQTILTDSSLDAPLDRVTNRDAKREAKAEQKRLSRAYDEEQRRRYEFPGK